ncbi:MAG: YjbH domain-containing protein [Nitritalea sp.]
MKIRRLLFLLLCCWSVSFGRQAEIQEGEAPQPLGAEMGPSQKGMLTAEQQARLKETLREAGFEQVHLLEEERYWGLVYEHRNFRDPYASIALIERILAEQGLDKEAFRYVPLLLGETLGLFTAAGLLEPLSPQQELQVRRKWRPEGYRYNFRLMPDLNIRFGNFEQPVQEKFGMLLDTRFYLLPGLSLHTGLYLPISNRLDRTSDRVHVGPTHLNFFRHLGKGHFMLVQTGLFVYDRYGWDVQYRYMPLDGRLSFGAQLAQTGFYAFARERFFTEALGGWMLLGDVEYRLPFEGLVLKASAGRFLVGDRGVRGELIRQYGTWELGFFVSRTGLGNNAGFQLAFPLWPGRLLRTRKIELRTTEEFRWEYGINAEDPLGRRFRTGTPRLDDLLRQYQYPRGF